MALVGAGVALVATGVAAAGVCAGSRMGAALGGALSTGFIEPTDWICACWPGVAGSQPENPASTTAASAPEMHSSRVFTFRYRRLPVPSGISLQFSSISGKRCAR